MDVTREKEPEKKKQSKKRKRRSVNCEKYLVQFNKRSKVSGRF